MLIVNTQSADNYVIDEDCEEEYEVNIVNLPVIKC